MPGSRALAVIRNGGRTVCMSLTRTFLMVVPNIHQAREVSDDRLPEILRP